LIKEKTLTKTRSQVAKKGDRRVNVEYGASEYQECLAFYQWTQLQPQLKGLVIHIPNEGKRSYQAGRLLKRIGLCSGVPDYFIPISSNGFHGMWIEMKRKNVTRLTINQGEWIMKLYDQGYYCYVAPGAEIAIEVTQAYLDDKL
jgi:VRR-NUC domain